MDKLRPAREDDLPALAELAMRAKASWGYDADFMAACRPILTLTPEDLHTSQVTVLDTAEGDPIAMVQLMVDGAKAELHHLYVDPRYFGQGLGRLLCNWAIAEARKQGAETIELEADPNAAPFYEHLGFIPISMIETGIIPGRTIPVMQRRL